MTPDPSDGSVKDWQPIETAPKDDPSCEILMVSEENGIRVVRYAPWAWSKKAEWFIGLTPGISGGMYMANPTHWMPLPEPPK